MKNAMGQAVPPLDPRRGDYDRMLARAGHLRRARRTRVAATAMPVLFAVVLANVVAPAGNRSLEPASGGISSPTTPTRAARTPARRTPTVQPTPKSKVTSGGEAKSEPSPSPASETPFHESPPPEYEEPVVTTSQDPDGYVVSRTAPQVGYTYPDDPSTRRYVEGAAPEECTSEAEGTSASGLQDEQSRWNAEQFCIVPSLPKKVVAGEVADFSFSVCRSRAPGVGEHTLTSEKYGLFVMEVLGEDAQRGTWGRWNGAMTPAPGKSVSVKPGDCVEWTYSWRAVAEGRKHGPLPPGTYGLSLRFFSVEYRPYWGDKEHPQPGYAPIKVLAR